MTEFKMRVGSRRQVWNRTAKMTSGGLTRNDLFLKNGRIKSKAACKAAKARMNAKTKKILEKGQEKLKAWRKKHQK